ncbi:MAG: carboxypeptidase-like regulatory domain-containing protein [Thermoguttaceae bacterium]|nr:carboxypeptidase-like regulatory domain-containing protein [Thermoguttaceae bacterium]MDW8078857.1 carboxypeptidase-like regulatory domain-containing protein [Thermoguttaceae bacterium]
MRANSCVSRVLVILLVLGFCLPKSPILAAGTANQLAPRDVALTKDGILLGQVVDAQGVPQREVPVTLMHNGRVVGNAKTNEQGYFAFKGLKGGVYQVAAANGVASYRVWQPNLAPPGAGQGALVVANQDLTRGQIGGCLGMFLSRPLVVAGVVAAAIAIPVAIAVSEEEEEAPATP